MKKYEVEVKVNWHNMFVINAENEKEAAAKAKEAMDVLMEYNITYDTEDENAVWNGGWDNITVEYTHEYNEDLWEELLK